MAFPFKFGSEFLVNTATTGHQLRPDFTALADGRFLAVWTSPDGGDGSASGFEYGAYGQIFNADGTPSGSEFRINTTTNYDQNEPVATALDGGGFVVTWVDDSWVTGSFSSNEVRAQVYDATGAPVGAELLVNSTVVSHQNGPAITTLADGRFVISWTDASAIGGDTSSNAIRAQIFNADGSTSGAEFLVNTTTANAQYDSAITALTDGRFVISWTDQSVSGGDTSGPAIRAQMYNANGTAYGSEFRVNTTTTNDQSQSSMTALADGRFVVTWSDGSLTGGDTSSNAVRAQVYNGDGTLSGVEFLVNTTTSSGQSQSTVAALADGRFVVAWTDGSATGGDTSSNAIRAQVFNIDGTLSGAEFLVNTTTAGSQLAPSVTVLADGRFVIGWQDDSVTGSDTTGSAIRAQIFDPRESAVTLDGSLLDDDFVGTRFGDHMSGFIGDDILLGRSGDDRLFGEAGNDDLFGNTGNDRLFGGDGADFLRGNGGSDKLFGGDGRDNLGGGFGIDYMDGGNGNDIYFVDVIGDIVFEGASGGGNDRVRSGTISLDLANYANVEGLWLMNGVADLDLVGNDGANSLTGNDGANKIIGKGGDDNIDGKGGADQLTGGMGRDILKGGSDADRFIFNDASETGTTFATRDKITDFSQAQGDLIDVSGIDAGSAGGDQAFTFIGGAGFSGSEGELRFFQTATRAVVLGDIDGDGVQDFSIELTGLIALVAGDFVL